MLHFTLTWSLVLLVGVGCSGGSQQQIEEQLNANGDTGEQINNSNTNDAGDLVNEEFNDGEQINNAADNEFAQENTGSNNELNLGNNQGLTQQAALTNLPAENPAAPNTEPPLPTATNIMPTNAVVPVDTTAVPAPAVAAAPSGAGMVKYVRATTTVLDQVGGTAVATFEQGDHPVVWDDGQYAKLSDGKVLPSTSLSDRGIGRAFTQRGWRSGGE
jgi:hypothetical protein